MLQKKLNQLFSLPILYYIYMIVDIFHHFLDQWNTDSPRSKYTYKILRSLYIRLHKQTKILNIAIFIYKKPLVGSGENKTKGWWLI